MFTISNNLSPDSVIEIFEKRANSYNFRSNSNFRRPQEDSVYHGSKLLSFLQTKI